MSIRQKDIAVLKIQPEIRTIEEAQKKISILATKIDKLSEMIIQEKKMSEILQEKLSEIGQKKLLEIIQANLDLLRTKIAEINSDISELHKMGSQIYNQIPDYLQKVINSAK